MDKERQQARLEEDIQQMTDSHSTELQERGEEIHL